MRIGLLCLLPAIAIAFAGDGIPPRGSAEDSPAHQIAGELAIGAAYVPPSQLRKLFGEDLEKHGYVVFEVGVFPVGQHPDASADGFKLMQGKKTGIVGAASPYDVAAAVWPQPSDQPWAEMPVPGAATPAGKRIALQRKIEEKSLPKVNTNRAAAGYLFFLKSSKDQRADYELLYLDLDEKISLRISSSGKP